MLQNRLFRTFIPTVIGYLTFKVTSYLFELKYPLEPLDDLNTPGIVFLFEYIGIALFWIGILLFQYRIIIPRTFNSITRSTKMTLVIGLGFALLFGSLNYFLDNAEFNEATITFFRALTEFESFFLGNLFSIQLMNWLTVKNQNNEA